MEFILYLLPHSPSFHLKGHLEAMIDCFLQPTPLLLPGKSHGWEPGRLQSMGSQRVIHD